MSKRYTEAKRAEIVEHYRVHGQAATVRKYGCSSGSLYGWRKAAGVVTEVANNAQEAQAVRRAQAAEKRARARYDLATAAAALAKQLAATDILPTKEIWQAATAIKVLTETLRLEDGETTSNSEVTVTETDRALAVERLTRKMLDEAERITGTTSKG